MRHDLFLALAALSTGPAEATEILERLDGSAAAGPVPSVPTLYRRLRDGVEAGWIEVEGVPPAGRGRPGQRYRLTPEGEAAVRAEAVRWRAVVDLVLGGS